MVLYASMTLSAVIRGGNTNDDDGDEESIMSNNEKEVEGIAAFGGFISSRR
jgi:hypothetical protein